MRRRLRDIIFLIIGVGLTIIFYAIVIPFLAIIGLVKVISMIKHFMNSHKHAKINS